MVYSGRPSGACENCRKVHKKCDERKPECWRCVRTGKTCSGYRDQASLLFRDETGKTREKVQQRRNSAQLSMGRKSPMESRISFSRSLLPTKEEIAICNFYHFTTDNLSDEDPTLYLQKQLPHLYARCKLGSVLHLALEAVSFAASEKIISQANQLGMDRYSKAARVLRQTIETGENPDDQTLYGVLLLCGYETITGQLCTPVAWGNHVDGALALLKLRASSLTTSLSHGIFSFIQKNTVIKQMQMCQPVDDMFSQGLTSSCIGPERHLISLASEIPKLQCQSVVLEQLEMDEIGKLSHDASVLSVKLSAWTNTVPHSWKFVTALRINDGTFSEYAPCVIHKYRHHYIARVWNFYRVSQLILHSICLRAKPFLAVPADDNKIGQRITGLVDDICASVPFLLGTDLGKMKFDFTRRDPWPTSGLSAKSIEHAQVGRFSLIWPLHVSCSASQIPQAQKDWMRKQLYLLAKNGIPLARIVCKIDSQILLGKPEMFVFDCV